MAEVIPVVLTFVWLMTAGALYWSVKVARENGELRSQLQSEEWRNEQYLKRLEEAGLSTNIFRGNIILGPVPEQPTPTPRPNST
jgi:hypothetical protein